MSEHLRGGLQLIDAARFRELTEQAAASPRKRSHLLLHSGPDDLVQRLIISAQPGTYGSRIHSAYFCRALRAAYLESRAAF